MYLRAFNVTKRYSFSYFIRYGIQNSSEEDVCKNRFTAADNSLEYTLSCLTELYSFYQVKLQVHNSRKFIIHVSWQE